MAFKRHTSWLHAMLLAGIALLALGWFLQRELALTGGRLGAPLDDAWIHFQFARNLAAGAGFSFNAGEPTPASTAPLWTLLLAPIGIVSEAFLVPALSMSALFFLFTGLLTYGLARALIGSAWAALLAGLGTILAGRFLWAGLAGMETTAFAAASVAAVWLYHRRGLGVWTGLLFGIAAQLRPEGHALFLLALLNSWWDCYRRGERRGPVLRDSAVTLAAYLLVSLPYVLFSLGTTGRPLPNTFYAKAGAEQLYSLRTIRETLLLHWQDNPVAFLLIPFGVRPIWRREPLVLLWLFGLWLLVPAIVEQVWHHGRYTLPLVPFQMIVAAAGARWLWQRSSHSAQVAGFLRPVLLLLFILGGFWRLNYWAGMLGYNAREILAIDVAMGEWLAHNTPSTALIAVDDIGAIGFLSERRILDLQGLISPELWPVLQEPYGQARNEALLHALAEHQPDYLAIFPNWHFELAMNTQVLTPVERFWVDSHTIIFDQEAMVYLPDWPYLSEAQPERLLQADFAEAVSLLGYDLETGSRPVTVTLYWKSLNRLGESYDVFIHLVDGDGNIVAQADGKPVAGLAPTTRWQPGDIIRDRHALSLPDSLAPGNYRLRAGLYLRDSGARLSLSGEGQGDSLDLGGLDLPGD